MCIYYYYNKVKDGESAKLDEFFAANSYVKGSYTEKSAFEGLSKALLNIEKGKPAGNRLFYLALPPSVFDTVTTCIKTCCMSNK